MTQPKDEPATLRERLAHASSRTSDPLYLEAARRVQALEELCGMMTDTGVILEEDAAELAKADWWWVPGDPECSYSSLEDAMSDMGGRNLQILQWECGHQLPDVYAVRFGAVADGGGRVFRAPRVEAFYTYEAAEEAVAEHELLVRRYEMS